jgi:hypothetical protein
MKFLANENMPRDAVEALRATGHDVAWVRELGPGMIDREVVAWSRREDRVLLTFDKDFGEIAYRSDLPATCGIILFRMPMPASDEAGARLASLVSARDDWAGSFAVIEPGRVRLRDLPGVRR